MKPSDAELKPCPFCGGSVRLEKTIDGREWWGIVCRNTGNRGGSCAVSIAPSASKRAAIDRWNTRTPSQQPASVPAELVKRVHEAMIADGISSTDMFAKMANYFAAYGRERAQWVSVSERLPPPNKKVLVHYTNGAGKGRTVCGFHCGEKERDSEYYGGFEDGGDWSDDGEHFYWPAVWYESIENWEDYSAVAIYEGVPTRWMPLPESPTCAAIGTTMEARGK